MYREHFGLKENPFSIAPDPRYLFLSEGHREALAHLEFGLRGSSGGFVLLTGEVGTGKTTVCRCLLENMPDDAEMAFILNPKVTVEELLATVCDELRIFYPEGNRSVKVFVDRINEFLLDVHGRGRKTVLIIEEAQNLGTDVLEQLRLLTNLETNKAKLLQIIMIGQPELRDMLSKPELRQLSQRITARYHLGALTKGEVSSYVAHRLSVAGGHTGLFPASTVRHIFRLSGGVPRLINVLCDRSLLGAYVEGKQAVDRRTLARASEEVLGGTAPEVPPARKYALAIASLLLIALGTALGAAYYDLLPGKGTASPAPPEKDRVTATVPARPGLDTLWWLDERSLPGKSLKVHAKRGEEISRWAVEDKFQKKAAAVTDEVTGQENAEAGAGQKPEPAAPGSGD
jgi:general secretion pathway protein A